MSESAQKYLRFFVMIAVSMVVMYGVMYLHTYELDHVHFSETRLFMTLLMGASMMVVMLLFMLRMYDNTLMNLTILCGAVVLFIVATWLVRLQATVGDEAYMDGMIPHHSIALLTSERADIEDLRVRELADGIIAAQKREIAEIKWLLGDIERNGPATTQEDVNARPVPEF